jgi:decaprenylphospho-beta-D-ribofuranose 2-oxidase
MGRELLAGWGRTAPTAADVSHPSSDDGAVALLAGTPERGAVARGLGRSYGDAAQNAGGTVICTDRLAGIAWADEGTLVRVAGGASLGDVMAFLSGRARALAVVPGTRHVSVGGAIAADVHGKNHPADGSFAGHVVELTLATPAGLRWVTPAGDADLFWATAGGMGLTGVVVDATLSTLAVETDAVRVVSRRAGDVDEAMAALDAESGRHRYAVAWLDGLAKGRATGRGVVAWGDHAGADDVLPARRVGNRRTVAVPAWLPGLRVPGPAVAALNRARYSRSPASDTVSVEPLDRFLFPLDALDGWNRLYGRTGFVQYQFVVPFGAGDLVAVALRRLRDAGCPPFLAVLKRMGAADPGPLSFPMPGWTLALDVPTAAAGLAGVLDDLDELVAGAGGRVYLAKDARLRPELVGAMYPGLDRWRETQRAVDPAGVLTSDLGRRLGLVRSRAGAG